MNSTEDSALDFLKEQLWIPIVVGIVLLVLLGLLVWCLCRWCHHRRYDYTALQEDMALPAKMELERRVQQDQIRDAALMNCQYYVRSVGRYSIINQLPEIGSRFNKHWFMVRDGNDREEKILSMTHCGDNMKVPFNAATKKTLTDIFILLRHPYIYPKSDIDIVQERNLVVNSEPFNTKGSLKDIIYLSKCTDLWQNKYGLRSKGLPLVQVQLYGRQILEGLLFLEDKGFPSHGHLHSGNVIIQNYVASYPVSMAMRMQVPSPGGIKVVNRPITGYENVFFDMSSKLQPLLKKKLRENKDALDILCFGHLLFEMSAGYELDTAHPEPRHLVSVSHSPVIQVLNFIFETEDAFYPTLRQVVDHEFFKNVQLRELQTFNPVPIHLTSQMKTLLRSVRKGKNTKGPRSVKGKSSRKSSVISVEETDQSTSKSRKKSRPPSAASSAPGGPPVAIPPPPKFVPAPPTSPPGAPAPSCTEGRGALLGAIRLGTNLKKTVTVDKSAPRV